MSKARGSLRSETKIETKLKKIEENPLKVFILHKEILKDLEELKELQLLKLQNPGTEKVAYYVIDNQNKQFYQLIQFNQPNRSFFIDDFVNSDGKIYITQPLDIKFLFLYYIRKHARNRAIAIDQIDDEEFSVTVQTLSKYADKKELEKICDVKDYEKDLFFVKYNQNKSLAWLSLVTKNMVHNIKKNNIRIIGSAAQSANFEKSSFLDESLSEEKLLIYAWGIIGTFVTEDLHLELAKYMNIKIPSPKSINEDTDKKNNKKRKPLENIDEETNKKMKMEITLSPEQNQKPKEKIQTTKEKKLAKAACGTKSLMSFFKK